MAYPTLRTNEVIGALYNQIIGIQTEANNIAGVYGKLLEAMRVEGSMYGDTKLYIDTDCLKSSEWGMDAEAGNLLALHRPPEPHTQALVIDHFRQISVSLDNYISRRAFSDEGSFSQFNDVVRGWVGDTKKVYDATTFNTFVGTAVSPKEAQNITIDATEYPSLGQGIGEVLADLIVDLGDVRRDFNDLGFLRSYSEDDLVVVWNATYVSSIRKNDISVIYHKEGLISKFADYVLPARYFGSVNDVSKTTADSLTRSLVEIDVGSEHLFPGDLIPEGTELVKSGAIIIPSYQEDSKVICKVMCKGSVPFMSSFSVGTSFFNPKSLTETQHLTWSHNSLAYRVGKPYITIKEA